ncbi:hypothetical protein ACFRMN_27290 [Streptomyces sp. NPDC056835]|uniref:hypothetical protein n=1 Tax=Streptomyces sp. NPDC056835 TaxID=3345956 RepID=UPI0036BBD9D7
MAARNLGRHGDFRVLAPEQVPGTPLPHVVERHRGSPDSREVRGRDSDGEIPHEKVGEAAHFAGGTCRTGRAGERTAERAAVDSRLFQRVETEAVLEARGHPERLGDREVDGDASIAPKAIPVNVVAAMVATVADTVTPSPAATSMMVAAAAAEAAVEAPKVNTASPTPTPMTAAPMPISVHKRSMASSTASANSSSALATARAAVAVSSSHPTPSLLW